MRSPDFRPARRGRPRAPARRGAALAAISVLLAAGCTTTTGPDAADTPPPAAESSRSPVQKRPSPVPARTVGAQISKISDAQWARIKGAGVWRPGCPVGRAGLRRVDLNYWSFDGEVRRGGIVVNQDVAASVVRVFTRLFEERFPIRRMTPIEAYRGDDDASMRADNTSAFNCRRQGQANAPAAGSPHANGRAVDINPLENPWKDTRCSCWMPSAKDSGRTPGKGKILKGGLVWRAFTAEGWIWQDIDVPDYQHFDTGYPSKPFRATGPAATGTPVGR
ncbi:M15 family metallopeptidase [Streptomyces sp. NPDC051940]|uniref:M15 family metallopeptidase n=1 Tax=Streptomyces sp. NPDC051940 TaxID=3155675 RepID=UPI00343A345F